MPEQLVEPVRQCRPEAGEQGRAGQGGQLADALETQPLQGLEQIGLQSQRRRRQGQDGGPCLGRQLTTGTELGPGPGQRQPVRHGQPMGQAQPVEAPAQIGEQRALAAEQVAAAGEVDRQPVDAVDHHPRAVAAAP